MELGQLAKKEKHSQNKVYSARTVKNMSKKGSHS